MARRFRRLHCEPLEPRDVPVTLQLGVAPNTFAENAGATAATGTVTRFGGTAGALTVNLTSSDATEATVPASVTIPDGQAAATFPVAAVDDAAVDGPQTVTLSAVPASGVPPVGPDASFGVGGYRAVPLAYSLQPSNPALAVQADGKIVVAAQAPAGGDWAVSRVNPDGSLDTAFGTGGTAVITFATAGQYAAAVHAVLIRPDGKIVVAGTLYGGGTQAFSDIALARLNANGTLDPDFGTGGKFVREVAGQNAVATDAVLLPDNRVLVAVNLSGAANGFTLFRTTANGASDGTFGTNGLTAADPNPAGEENVQALARTADGKLILSGGYTSGTVTGMAAVRLNADATFDTSFSGDGRILIPSTAFAAGFQYGTATAVTAMPDGRIVLAGTVLNATYDGSVAAARLTAAGTLDTAFSGDGLFLQRFPGSLGDEVYDAAVLPDGGVILAGSAFLAPNGRDLALTRLTPAGVPDATFSGDGFYSAPPLPATFESLFAVDLLADGRLAALGGYNTDMRVAAFTVGGPATATVTVLDNDTVPPPVPPTLTVTLPGPLNEHAGPAAAVGTVTRSGGDPTQSLTVFLSSSDTTELTVPASVTFAANATAATFPLNAVDDTGIDGTQTVTVTASLPGGDITGPIVSQAQYYGSGGIRPSSVAVLPDGRVLIVGTAGGNVAVARYLANGQLDATWNGGSATNSDVSGGTDNAEGVWLYPDGRVLVVGTGPGGAHDLVLVRYTPAGLLDTSFDGDGKLSLDVGTGAYQEAWDVAVTPDGKIVLAVTVERGAPTYLDFAAVRLNADGTRDTAFGTNGLAVLDFANGGDRGVAVAVQADGKVLVAGQAGGVGTLFGVARFTAAGIADNTFGTGGKMTVDLPDGVEGASDVLVRPDGRILLVGRAGRNSVSAPSYDPALVQLLPSGALDSTFGVNGVRIQSDTAGTFVFGPVEAALQADGRVVVAATVGATRATAYTRVMRFSAAGTQEHAVTGPYQQSVAEDVAILQDGNIYIAYTYGSTGAAGFVDRFRTAPGGGGPGDTETVAVRDNEPFQAVADTYLTTINTPITVTAAQGLLANDTVTLPINPTVEYYPVSNGTVTVNADGSFSLTPDANYTGPVYINYWIRDGAASSNIVSATITVNTLPVAVNDAFATDEDVPLTVAQYPYPQPAPAVRLAFDEAAAGAGPATNGGTLPTLHGTFVGAATRTAATTIGRSPAAVNNTTGANGYVTLGDVDAVDANTAMTVGFWFRLTAVPQNNDVLIEDWNPSLFYPPAGHKGWSVTFDNVTETTFAIQQAFHESSGTSAGSTGGYRTFLIEPTLNKWMFYAITFDPTDHGPYGAAYSATAVYIGRADTRSGTFNKSYTPHVLGGPNDFPLTVGGSPYPYAVGTGERTPPAVIDEVFLYDRALSQTELDALHAGTGAKLGLLYNDSDANLEVISVSTVTQPAHGTVTWTADGTFTYTPHANYHGPDGFTYRITDGNHESAPATVSLTVRPRPDALPGIQVNNGSRQRSRVTSLTVAFDSELDTALLAQPGAFTVRRAHDNATVGTVTAVGTLVNGQTRVVLTFAGANTDFGSLADGRWVVTANRAFIVNTTGGVLAANYSWAEIHRLFGDGDGTGAVDRPDRDRFLAAFGEGQLNAAAIYVAHFDFDGDGDIDRRDLRQFNVRFGTRVP